MVVVKQLEDYVSQFDPGLLGDDQAIISLGQEKHVINHPRHALQVLQVGVEILFIGIDIAFLAQHDLGVGHQVANGRA